MQLDVTDAASIASAAARIERELGRLDVLVNNAGIAHAGDPNRSLDEIVSAGRASVASLAEVRAVFETNVFGAIAVTQALLPLLRAAPAGRIVNVSSGRGSLTLAADPTETRRRAMFGVTYAASKAALNAVTLAFALDLTSTRIKVNAAAPGFTVTDMNHGEGRRSVDESAREPVRLALLGADGPTGGFFDDAGPVAWRSAARRDAASLACSIDEDYPMTTTHPPGATFTPAAVTPMQVALARPLRRAPDILLNRGTTSMTHPGANVDNAVMVLPPSEPARLSGVAA